MPEPIKMPHTRPCNAPRLQGQHPVLIILISLMFTSILYSLQAKEREALSGMINVVPGHSVDRGVQVGVSGCVCAHLRARACA